MKKAEIVHIFYDNPGKEEEYKMSGCLCYTTNKQVMEKFGPKYGVSLPNRPVQIDHELTGYERGDGAWIFQDTRGDFFAIHPKWFNIQNRHLVVVTERNTYIFRVI